MKYERISAGQYIFQEGDLSNDKLYIILSGTVSIIFQKDRNVFIKENLKHEAVDNLESQGQGETPKKNIHRLEEINPAFKKVRAMVKSVVKFSLLNSRNKEKTAYSESPISRASRSMLLNFNDTAQLNSSSKKRASKKIRDLQNLLTKEYTTGESFGEKALTSKDAKRSASAFTKEDCEFIILMKEDYLKIVAKFNKENRFKMNFLLTNLPFIDRITSRFILDDFLYIFTAAYLNRGNTVTEEGKAGSRIYLLVEGECVVEKTLPGQDLTAPRKIFIAKIGPPTLIGEELLFAKQKTRTYSYGVKVIEI